MICTIILVLGDLLPNLKEVLLNLDWVLQLISDTHIFQCELQRTHFNATASDLHRMININRKVFMLLFKELILKSIDCGSSFSRFIEKKIDIFALIYFMGFDINWNSIIIGPFFLQSCPVLFEFTFNIINKIWIFFFSLNDLLCQCEMDGYSKLIPYFLTAWGKNAYLFSFRFFFCPFKNQKESVVVLKSRQFDETCSTRNGNLVQKNKNKKDLDRTGE